MSDGRERVGRVASTSNAQDTGLAWNRVEALLAAALDLPHDARASFLDTACAEDPALHAEVAALLEADERQGPVDVPVATLSGLLQSSEQVDVTMQLEPGSPLGPYLVVSPLGAGGMGQVYRARDTRLDREVAVKIVAPHLQRDPAARKRLEREARVIASLSHPNIVAIHDIGDHDGMLYIVTELLSGRTLREMLQSGALDERAIVDIAMQVARGLSAAHGSRVAHRDLKPENLFMTQRGVVKILDFGLAKPHPDANRDHRSVTSEHAVVGTIGYMSPEQITGGAVDGRSDLFSLGAVLYEAATGTPAFAGETRPQIAAAILASPPPAPDPSRVSPPLAQTIARCLARSPDDRYQNAADLAFTLQLLAADPRKSHATTTHPVARDSRRRWWARAGGVAALATVLGIVAGLAARGVSEPSNEPPLTFVVHAPEGARFTGTTMQPYPAVSPDGRRMAFVAFSGPQPGLWVQALGELDARLLTRTDNDAPFPFWSPDGMLIGFGSPERLQKVAESGARAPQELCACNARWGGSWGRDGTIVFAGDAGLFQVSSIGGEARPVTRVDPSLGELSHRFPVLLPDGRRFLYLILSAQETHRGVYLGSLDDPAIKRRMLPDDSNVAYGPGPGGREYLFFVRDHVLLAQPFDTARATLESDPIVMAQPVVPGEGGRFAPFAVGGRSLVYRLRDNLRTALLWMNRSGVRERRVNLPDAYYRNPAISHDGTKLAVMVHDTDTRRPDIWMVDLLRGVTERLTRDRVGAFFPQWMPDGQRVVFASARSGRWNIYSQAITEREDRPLFDSPLPQTNYPTGVTGDGRFVLTEGQQVWALPLTPADGRMVLASGRHGRVSPDGRWLAYVAYDTGNPEVYVTTFPTPNERWRVSTTGGRYPHWGQNGRELYFVGGDNTLMAVPVRARATFELDAAQPLFRVWPDVDSGGFGSVYAPAPDGQRFIVTEIVGADESSTGVEELLLIVTANWSDTIRGRMKGPPVN